MHKPEGVRAWPSLIQHSSSQEPDRFKVYQSRKLGVQKRQQRPHSHPNIWLSRHSERKLILSLFYIILRSPSECSWKRITPLWYLFWGSSCAGVTVSTKKKKKKKKKKKMFFLNSTPPPLLSKKKKKGKIKGGLREKKNWGKKINQKTDLNCVIIRPACVTQSKEQSEMLFMHSPVFSDDIQGGVGDFYQTGDTGSASCPPSVSSYGTC